MPETAKLGLVLLLICAIATGLLGFVNAVTVDRIAELEAATAASLRAAVMPDADDITERLGEAELADVAGALGAAGTLEDVYTAKKAGQKIGYTIAASASGFGGPVRVLVGIGLDGKVAKAIVTPVAETPGLGAKASDEAFSAQFAGLGTDSQVSVKKDGGTIDAITGATVTSRAAAAALSTAFEAYNKLDGGAQ
jgi:electron transport complex protein RnfG